MYSATMFKHKVITNKVRPNANATNACGLAKSVSPVNCFTIVTVTVETASNGFACKSGLFPAAKTTIMVSPTARETANKKAPVIPGNAAGKTT
ncbi:hypothetical protein D9M71_614990 [compost metagenome]